MANWPVKSHHPAVSGARRAVVHPGGRRIRPATIFSTSKKSQQGSKQLFRPLQAPLPKLSDTMPISSRPYCAFGKLSTAIGKSS